ncbi:insulinase family protein [Acinetobacter haemolyticus]|uniref:Insulinase family protein n=1 Tax=Acinetobacter haemolyticus TaxID=29430 RepID=A0AAJ3D836_ACIHA|nr:pitrilysin family protein [Acinetobacter haemolyticus]NAR17436.1 insulinase family protein [Acinetobacter haemolyticus]NAR29349.1 insulinase family protein [Acinetobacter haemolyticus]NAR35432.1 insulinase family protein [Acinetobacter haemolyticus]NAR46309.1 insulinase family protein [Acinetobacter haemolyticus]NAR62837.1 insulinase family protein [Acinetobacter haemolyticus]
MLTRFKQLTLSLCLIGLSATSWSQAVLVKSERNIEEYKLDNGFRVILAPNEKENKVYVNTVYLTGSLNDPKGKGGLAHLLEHLAFKGTVNVKGDEFQRRLDQYTLMTNASTDYYSTKYINIVRPEKNALNEILYLEAERMDKLVLQEKFVPAEIEIVKREREIRMDQPFAVLMDQMLKAAYGNQYLGRLPIGDLAELKSINMSELNQFYRTWYAPNNAIMVISGKFDKAEVLKKIDQHFSPIPARPVPVPVQVPVLDSTMIKQRQFSVEKGSDLAKFHIYMNGKNSDIAPALALAPGLFTLQPSGSLYKSMVETGISTAVQSTTWLDQDFNLVFMGAIYAPNHDEKQVSEALTTGVEKKQAFSEVELQRLKNITQNAADTIANDAVALGSRLSDYAVTSHGQWDRYFKDLQAIQALKVDELNTTLKQFLVPEHRISGDIRPTPEDQKKAMTLSEEKQPKTLDQTNEVAEPLKDVKVYQQEVAQFVEQSAQQLQKNEQKIQRGQLKNGIRYALYPTSTRDDKTYATISLDFGDEKALFGKATTLDLASYLMLRGSEKHTLQEITDKAIAASGGASVSSNGNGLTIVIQAKKDKFEDFFSFIVDVLKQPKFAQTEFDLAKNQSLSALDRPYTEPAVVASMTLSRVLEIYQPGDLRYHFEPELAKKQLNEATQAQVKQFYDQFFETNYAQIAITGDFDAKKMKKTLQKTFGSWKAKQPFRKVTGQYTEYKAQKIHALSEQREFGSYQSILAIPVGSYHPDAPALIVLSHILGNSQLSSRLAQELREKNALVYGFGSGLDLDPDIDDGTLSITANYTAGRSGQVSQSVHKVLNDLLSKGVTAQEVEAAKADIMKKRVTALEDERRIHGMLTSQLERNKTLLDRAVRDQEFAKLSKDDVDRVIKKYIKLEHFVEVMADQYGQAQDSR